MMYVSPPSVIALCSPESAAADRAASLLPPGPLPLPPSPVVVPPTMALPAPIVGKSALSAARRLVALPVNAAHSATAPRAKRASPITSRTLHFEAGSGILPASIIRLHIGSTSTRARELHRPFRARDEQDGS